MTLFEQLFYFAVMLGIVYVFVQGLSVLCRGLYRLSFRLFPRREREKP